MDNENQQSPIVPDKPSIKPLNNLSFFKAIALGFTVVSIGISIAVGGYLLGASKTKSQPLSKISVTPSVSPTPDPTVNWKMYTNLTYGYSIKFPTTYEISPQTEREKSQLGIDQNRCITLKQTGTCTIVIDYWQKSLGDILKIKSPTDGSLSKDYIVGNIAGKMVVYKIGESTTQDVIILPKSLTESVTLTYSHFPVDIETSRVVNQILSTFKFTK